MSEEFLTLAEIKELLDKEQKKRELTSEQNFAHEHAKLFSKISSKDAKKLVKELTKIEPVTPAHACKLVDLMPQYEEEVRAVFLKERVTVDEETIEKILEKIREYL
jgi:DNA-directed RNA polymerase subunit F